MNTLLTIGLNFLLVNLVVFIVLGLIYLDVVVYQTIRDWFQVRRNDRARAAYRASRGAA